MEETGALTWERLRTLPTMYQYCNDLASPSLRGHHPARSACPRSLGVTAQRCAVVHMAPSRPVAASDPMALPPESLARSFKGLFPMRLRARSIGRLTQTKGCPETTDASPQMGDSTGQSTLPFATHFPMHARPALARRNVNISPNQCRLAPRPFGVLPSAYARQWLPSRTALAASDEAPEGPRRVVGRGAVGRRRPEDAGLRPTPSARGRGREKSGEHHESK